MQKPLVIAPSTRRVRIKRSRRIEKPRAMQGQNPTRALRCSRKRPSSLRSEDRDAALTAGQARCPFWTDTSAMYFARLHAAAKLKLELSSPAQDAWGDVHVRAKSWVSDWPGHLLASPNPARASCTSHAAHGRPIPPCMARAQGLEVEPQCWHIASTPHCFKCSAYHPTGDLQSQRGSLSGCPPYKVA